MKREFRTAYVYSDHAIVIYEKHDRQAGRIEYAEIKTKLPSLRGLTEGRLIISCEELWRLFEKANHVSIHDESLKHGSPAMVNEGISQQTLYIQGRRLGRALAIPGNLYLRGRQICTSDFTYQREATSETLDELRGATSWGSTHIANPLPARVVAA